MDIKLSAVERSKKERLLSDFIPAVLYGRNIPSEDLKLKRSEIDRVITLAGESNLITLNYQGKDIRVIIKESQRDGLSGKLLHIDLFQINMADKITTEIPLHFIGESKAVKEKSGFLIKDINSLEVHCLPNNLVDHIDVDISSLVNYHDEILVSDLVLPLGMELSNLEKRVVVSVMPPRVQEVTPETVETPAVNTAKEEKK